MSSNIQVFLRVRPSARPASGFEVDAERGTLFVELENHGKEAAKRSFSFAAVLERSATQEEVLEKVAKPVIDDVLKGLNGTIFAYGQTGSGKTFTITGGAERYDDRGLIPRTIAYLFNTFRRSESQYKMYISYLEIYQNKGYDLLREGGAKLEDLPKVQMQEDQDGHFHLKNLSVNVANNEEDALNLLFLGDTNRIVAETPMNDASTRSHCVFIIWIESTTPNSDVVRRSKLHLVDLAGSERVGLTGVEGKLLKEATSINQSLHFLERVIVALHSKSRGEQAHVPYRDSMMTGVLRDSLGGNCKTTMIACVAAEEANLPETISTCRFAQRVAQIKNNAKVNEELDPALLIQRLKREVLELKQELRFAKGGGGDENESVIHEELTDELKQHCQDLVDRYVDRSRVDLKQPFVCSSTNKMRICFRLLRDMCFGQGTGKQTSNEDPLLEMEAQKLRLEIAQRDAEIAMMVQMLSKRQQGTASTPFVEAPTVRDREPSISLPKGSPRPKAPPDVGERPPESASAALSSGQKPLRHQHAGVRPFRPHTLSAPSGAEAAKLLLDQDAALEVFRTTVYKPPAWFEEKKTLLKEHINLAKTLGEQAKTIRDSINEAKNELERRRTERAMTAAGFDDGASVEDGPEELALIQVLDRLRTDFRERTGELKTVKGEVELIQKLLSQNNARMQKEFGVWFASLRKQADLKNLDDETKRELHNQITGAAGPSCSAAGVPQSDAEHSSEQVEPTTFEAPPRTLPKGATFKAWQRLANAPASAYWASIREVSPQSRGAI